MGEPTTVTFDKQLPEKHYRSQVHGGEGINPIRVEQGYKKSYCSKYKSEKLHCKGMMKPWEEIPDYFINEYATVGDDDKKEPFLNRKIKKIEAKNIIVIKGPYL